MSKSTDHTPSLGLSVLTSTYTSNTNPLEFRRHLGATLSQHWYYLITSTPRTPLFSLLGCKENSDLMPILHNCTSRMNDIILPTHPSGPRTPHPTPPSPAPTTKETRNQNKMQFLMPYPTKERMVSFPPPLHLFTLKQNQKETLYKYISLQPHVILNSTSPHYPFTYPSTHLTLMQLLHPQPTLVNTSINRRRNRQRPANNRTHARQEPRETLRAGFPVDDLHRGDVLPHY